MTVSTPQLLLSAPNAASGYSAPGTVYNSLGKFMSTTQLNTAVPLDNLFPDMTGAENAAKGTDYQCLFFYNTDTTYTLTGVTAWLPTTGLQTSAITWAVGADPTGPVPYNSSSPQAGSITSPWVAPTVTSWVAPISAVTTSTPGATLGSVPPGYVAAFWISRTATDYVNPSGGSVLAGFNLQVIFDWTT